MSPVIAMMVVFCAICAVLMVMIVIAGVYFWLDYVEFKKLVKSFPLKENNINKIKDI